MGTWVSESEVRTYLGETLCDAVYDEDDDGANETAKITQDIEDAEAIVSASLAIGLNRSLPLAASKFVKAAVRLRVKAAAWDRHPEATRETGDRFRKQADELCAAVTKGKLLVEVDSIVPTPSIGSAAATDDSVSMVAWETDESINTSWSIP